MGRWEGGREEEWEGGVGKVSQKEGANAHCSFYLCIDLPQLFEGLAEAILENVRIKTTSM